MQTGMRGFARLGGGACVWPSPRPTPLSLRRRPRSPRSSPRTRAGLGSVNAAARRRGPLGTFPQERGLLAARASSPARRKSRMCRGAPCGRSLASLTAGDPSFSGSDAQAQGSPRYQRAPSVGDVGSRPAGGAVACVCSLPQPRSASKGGRQGPCEVSSQTCGRSRLLRSGQCLGACVVACFGGAC